MRGLIFNIQRFSVHDGPGIRTAVFLKGCALRCAWCQNPEGMSAAIRLWHFEKRCLGCGDCIPSCPEKALRSGGPSRIVVDQTACTLCSRCIEVCPSGALAYDGRETEAGDVIAEVVRDRVFYEVSGGGVTLTGGEPLRQAEFSAEILRLSHEHGISTAIETALAVDEEAVERVRPWVDLFLVDMKLADPEAHKSWTGSSNETVRKNFERLARQGARVRARIPLIPGVTATEQNLSALGRYVRSVSRQIPIELVNFNPLAWDKYRRMGIPYGFDGRLSPYSPSEVNDLWGYLQEDL
ncbi:MAG: glycyl-radical enzyme activating protein [Terriglobales bacterium]|jgi:pyruvate formate lyase activating enzyme